MAPKKNGVAPDVSAPTNDDGVGRPPYDAKWITVRDAAIAAGVTPQTVRNAYRNDLAFNPEGASPRWFATKMVDQFGNVTDYDVVYLDAAAIDTWLADRAVRPATPTHGGAKRRIVRLTDEQVAAQPKNDAGDACIALADGTLIVLELPPVGKHKPKNAAAPEVQAGPAQPAQMDLFDVELEPSVAA